MFPETPRLASCVFYLSIEILLCSDMNRLPVSDVDESGLGVHIQAGCRHVVVAPGKVVWRAET